MYIFVCIPNRLWLRGNENKGCGTKLRRTKISFFLFFLLLDFKTDALCSSETAETNVQKVEMVQINLKHNVLKTVLLKNKTKNSNSVIICKVISQYHTGRGTGRKQIIQNRTI